MQISERRWAARVQPQKLGKHEGRVAGPGWENSRSPVCTQPLGEQQKPGAHPASPSKEKPACGEGPGSGDSWGNPSSLCL